MRRVAALVVSGATALALLMATATCTQLLGVEPAETVPEGGPLPKCASGRASCRGALCDTDIVTNKEHCGACGNVCNSLNGSATCEDGRCTLVCTERYADCDGRGATGCESFLSTDVKNCGACGRDCRGTPCIDGVCIPIVVGATQGGVIGVSADDTNVFVQNGFGALEVFPLVGGAKTVALPSAFVTQSSYIAPTLFAVRRSLADATSTLVFEIGAYSRNGQNFRCLAVTPALNRLAVDSSSVAWSGGDPPLTPDAGPNPLAREVPASSDCDAGAPRIIASSPEGRVGESIVLDGPTAFLTAFDTTSSSTGILASVDRATGALKVLVPRARPRRGGGRTMAVDDKFVYWIDSEVFVRRIPKAGCPSSTPCQEEIFFEEFGFVIAVNVDDRAVYVVGSDRQRSYLQVIDKATSSPRRIPADVNFPAGDVTTTKDFVVWGIGNTIYRLSR